MSITAAGTGLVHGWAEGVSGKHFGKLETAGEADEWIRGIVEIRDKFASPGAVGSGVNGGQGRAQIMLVAPPGNDAFEPLVDVAIGIEGVKARSAAHMDEVEEVYNGGRLRGVAAAIHGEDAHHGNVLIKPRLRRARAPA